MTLVRETETLIGKEDGEVNNCHSCFLQNTIHAPQIGDNNSTRLEMETSKSAYGTFEGRDRNLAFSNSGLYTDVRITLSWENINVYTSAERTACLGNKKSRGPSKQILQNVSGVVEPGTLLAVMGASGAGKTTLLNVLTYRNRGNLDVSGRVKVNGGEVGRGITSLSAYVQQDDLFIGTLTVKEHLWFHSQLRMNQYISSSKREERVNDVMTEMGLLTSADTFIGIPGKMKGISGGERKRLAFASEVLTNPPVMFCDEPTSGLDSFMARNIVLTLKSLATKGRTIICTIHQPSSEVFELFDRLLLMAPGGRVAFMGPAGDALTFFGRCGYPCPTNYNPADHYIKTLAKVPGREERCMSDIKAICDNYDTSEYREAIGAAAKRTNTVSQDSQMIDTALVDISPYRRSWFGQFYAVFWRCWLSTTREPSVFRTRYLQASFLALFGGLIYWQQEIDQVGVMNINGALFLMVTQNTFGFAFAVIQCFPAEFPVFLREHHNGMYRVDVYFLCKTLAEIPQFILIPTTFTVIMYWCVGLYPSVGAFFINLAVMVLVCNVSVSLGYMLSSSSSNVAFVLALGPVFLVPVSVIGGFYINVDSIPAYFLWLKYVSWYTYANRIVIFNQWSNIDEIACDTGSVDIMRNGTLPNAAMSSTRCLETGQDVITSLGYKNVEMFPDFLMLLGLIVFFRVLAFILLFVRSRKSYKMKS